MLIGIFFIWLFTAVIVAFFDIKASLGLMISYILLVPYSSFEFSSIRVEYNYILLFIFLIYIFRTTLLNSESYDLTIIKPLAVFSILIFIGSFFSTGVDFSYQLTILRSYIIGFFFIPIMLWQVCKTKSDFSYFTRIVLVCFAIMLIYGGYCFLVGQNPYVATLSALFNKQDNNEIFSHIERAGLIGKIQSTTSHPMMWSVFLSLVLFASYSFWVEKKSYTYYVFVLLVVFNLFVCNVRTGIVASAIGMALLFTNFSFRSKLISLTVIIAILLLSIDTSIFGSFQPYIDSIIYFNDPNKNVGGSSLDMRMLQFGGAVSLWDQGGLLFGNGFGWCANYYALYGDHPILLGFESIIYVVLIENGVLGIIAYGFLFYSLFRINRNLYIQSENFHKVEFWLNNSLIVTYIIYVIITGVFGFSLFLILLTLLFIKTRLAIIYDETITIL